MKKKRENRKFISFTDGKVYNLPKAEIYVSSQMCEPLPYTPLTEQEFPAVVQIGALLREVVGDIERHSEGSKEREAALGEGAMRLRKLVEGLQVEEVSAEDDGC